MDIPPAVVRNAVSCPRTSLNPLNADRSASAASMRRRFAHYRSGFEEVGGEAGWSVDRHGAIQSPVFCERERSRLTRQQVRHVRRVR